MKLRLSLAALLLGASTLSAAAEDCTPQYTFKTIKPGVLTQAVVTYMPYSAVDAAGVPIGVDGEILREIARRSCLKVEGVPVDAAASMNYVISGRADLTTGGYYRTAARTKVVDLSDPLYLDQMGFVSKAGWSAFEEMKGKPIGTLQGDLWVGDLKKMYGNDLKLYPTLAQLQQDLEAGRIEAMIVGYSVAITAQAAGQLGGYTAAVAVPNEAIGASVNSGQGCFPMSKQNAGMLDAFNAIIADLHKEGFIAATLEKYGLDASAAETGEPRLLN